MDSPLLKNKEVELRDDTSTDRIHKDLENNNDLIENYLHDHEEN